MDLDLDALRTRGRAPNPPSATIIRALEASDLVLLDTEKGSTAPPLKRISERHHALARHLASGMGESEAAIICRYSPSRISILKADPAFRQLLNFYQAEVRNQYIDLHSQLSGLSADAASILAERLEEEPEKISVGQLMEITKMGADRTGFGPQTSQVNINVDLAGRLEAARKRVAEQRGKVIEG